MICIVSLATILFLNPDLLDQEVVLAYFFVIPLILEYKKRCDLKSMNCVLESVFVEIVQPNNEKNVILGCLYRFPNAQTEIFNDEI